MDNEVFYSYEDSPVDGKTYKLECGECNRKTNHTVIKSYRESWCLKEDDYYGVNDYTIIKCNGCDMVHFCKICSSSDDIEPVYDEKGEINITYPDRFLVYPLVLLKIEQKLNYRSIPKSVKEIYDETFIALESNLHKLSSVGIRTTLERICISEGVSKKIKLQYKIDKLYEIGVINDDMKNLLHKVRIFGNSEAHDGLIMSESDLSYAWSSINSLMRYIYGTKDQKEYFINKSK